MGMTEEPEKFCVSARQYLVGGMRWRNPLCSSKQQLTMLSSEILQVVDWSGEAGELAADEPKYSVH